MNPVTPYLQRLNALILPVDITTHAVVQARLQEAAENPALHFTQLLQTLPPFAWQELRQA